MDILPFLLPPFIACLVLTGIHTYLGIHVVARGVIFVDIALAQIAALGITVAILCGYEPGSTAAYFFALGFTTLGALFFSGFSDREIPQEGIIGVSFAVSSALSILIANALPHGAEHLKTILSGNILWVSWHDVVKTAIIYAGLGIFHYRFREKFLLLSFNPHKAEERGVSPFVWNLLFYLSFGLVITSSVQIGGILLVFSFLIVPSLCSLILFKSLRARILFGWAVGTAASAIGMGASYGLDLPTGPSIVACFGVFLTALLVSRRLAFLRSKKRIYKN